MLNIKEKLKNMIPADSTKEINKITGKIIKEACLKIKPSKSDVSGSFTSDVLLNAPDILFDHLSLIFKSFLMHGTVSLQLLSCAFLPLFKGGLKNSECTDSYRAIASSSQLLQLFDNVILLVWGHLLDSDSLQFGYKSGTSGTQCSWLVTEVVDHYRRKETAVTACLLDCSKAFDKCRFDLLFSKLMDRQLQVL